MQATSTLITGAGLTGLSCAHHPGTDYILVEKESEPGGIVCARIRHGGFLCDGTGHWLHLRNAALHELVNQLLARRRGVRPARFLPRITGLQRKVRLSARGRHQRVDCQHNRQARIAFKKKLLNRRAFQITCEGENLIECIATTAPARRASYNLMKLLVFTRIPPPHHGQSYIVQLLLAAFGIGQRIPIKQRYRPAR